MALSRRDSLRRVRVGGLERVCELGEPDFQRSPCDPIEVGFRTDEMERAMYVSVVFRGRETERRRRRLELVEWTERRLARRRWPVVIAVDRIALVGLSLNLPH